MNVIVRDINRIQIKNCVEIFLSAIYMDDFTEGTDGIPLGTSNEPATEEFTYDSDLELKEMAKGILMKKK